MPANELDSDHDGWPTCSGDCNNTDALIFPDAAEICDGRDNDCDSATNEFVDGDGDSYSVCAGDCNDSDPSEIPPPSNESPYADAGPNLTYNQTVVCNVGPYSTTCPACGPQTLTLDGSGSYDNDGDPLLVTWTGVTTIGGGSQNVLDGSSLTTDVQLNGLTTTRFNTASTTYIFTLIAYDCAGEMDSDTVVVTWNCTGS